MTKQTECGSEGLRLSDCSADKTNIGFVRKCALCPCQSPFLHGVYSSCHVSKKSELPVVLDEWMKPLHTRGLHEYKIWGIGAIDYQIRISDLYVCVHQSLFPTV